MHITQTHAIFALLTMLAITVVGLVSGRKARSVEDFNVGGRKQGTGMVAGALVGTMVGGASTVGTAQMAYSFGLSAWWFTLGVALGSVALAVLAGPLRRSGCSTLPGFLTASYGEKAGLLSGLFSSVGILLNIVVQVLSAMALIVAMTGLGGKEAAFLAALLIIGYVASGGVLSAGAAGLAKTFLMYAALVVVCVVAFRLSGGTGELMEKLPPGYNWFSLMGRGFFTETAALISIVVGVLSTQTYFQAIFSGKNVAISRNGAILSAALVAPTGIAGVLVGLFIRANYPDTGGTLALPFFVAKFLPAWFGGIVLGTLLVMVVGTGAGLALGVGTVFTRDIIRIQQKNIPEKHKLYFIRLAVAAAVMISFLLAVTNLNSLILQWTFLSMSLRGSACFFPLLAAIFITGRISARAATVSIAAGPLSAIAWAVFGDPSVDPLYIGLGMSFLVIAGGSFFSSPGPLNRHRVNAG